MKSFSRYLLSGIVLGSFFFLLLPVISSGVNESSSFLVTTANAAASCGTGMVNKGGVCIPLDTGLSQMTIFDLIHKFMSWLLAIVGMIAVIAFVLAGIFYLTAAGDEKQAERGKSIMKNAIIGIIVALSGLVIINATATFLTSGTAVF